MKKKNSTLKMKSFRGSMLLFLTSVIWGSAFAAQEGASAHVASFTLNFSRFLIGAVVLIPVYLLLTRKENKKSIEHKKKVKTSFIGGIICGVALFVASSLQQLGIAAGTNSGKAGFITVMYIVIVPLLGLFLKKKVRLLEWIAVAIAPFGLYLLCVQGGFTFENGDILLMACSVVFAIQILCVDRFSPGANGVLLSIVEFLTVSVLSAIVMLFTEKASICAVPNALIEILYLGIMSCGVAYTLQVVAQKDVNPTVASLIMSLESVFAVIAGIIVFSDIPTKNEIIGSVIIFIAVILTQLPQPNFKKEK